MSLRNRGVLERIRRALFRNAPAKAVSLAVAVVVFFFIRTTSLEQRFVTVPLEARLPPRTTVTAGLPATVTVTIRGEGETIFQLAPDDIVVYVDLTANRNEGDYRVPVLYEKRGEAVVVEPLEITLEPAEVTATLEQVVTRTVRVQPAVGAEPPDGWTLAGLVSVPPSVQVAGPRRRVQTLQTLATVPVDLSDTRESTTLEVRLDYDPRVYTLPGGATVQLVVTVSPVEPAEEGEPSLEPAIP